MVCIYLRTNSDLCHLQHKLIGKGISWEFIALKRCNMAKSLHCRQYYKTTPFLFSTFLSAIRTILQLRSVILILKAKWDALILKFIKKNEWIWEIVHHFGFHNKNKSRCTVLWMSNTECHFFSFTKRHNQSKKRALCSQLHNTGNKVPKITTTDINLVKPTGHVMHKPV